MITDVFINVNYFASGRGAKYCEKRVYMFVCLSVCISQK